MQEYLSWIQIISKYRDNLFLSQNPEMDFQAEKIIKNFIDFIKQEPMVKPYDKKQFLKLIENPKEVEKSFECNVDEFIYSLNVGFKRNLLDTYISLKHESDEFNALVDKKEIELKKALENFCREHKSSKAKNNIHQYNLDQLKNKKKEVKNKQSINSLLKMAIDKCSYPEIYEYRLDYGFSMEKIKVIDIGKDRRPMIFFGNLPIQVAEKL